MTHVCFLIEHFNWTGYISAFQNCLKSCSNNSNWFDIVVKVVQVLRMREQFMVERKWCWLLEMGNKLNDLLWQGPNISLCSICGSSLCSIPSHNSCSCVNLLSGICWNNSPGPIYCCVVDIQGVCYGRQFVQLMFRVLFCNETRTSDFFLHCFWT